MFTQNVTGGFVVGWFLLVFFFWTLEGAGPFLSLFLHSELHARL